MDGKALLLMAVAGYRTGKLFSYSNKVVDFCTEKGTCLFLGREEQTDRVSVAGGAAEGTGPRAPPLGTACAGSWVLSKSSQTRDMGTFSLLKLARLERNELKDPFLKM